MFPQLTLGQLGIVVAEELDRIKGPASIDDLYKYFAGLCAIYLIKLSHNSALEFMNIIYNRCVKHQYLNTHNNQIYDIGYHMEVRF
jgi:hypothetical protein